jgi:hypothetical protein
VDQPDATPTGTLTQNGLFWNAAKAHRDHGVAAEKVKVYEKIRTGIWVYAGLFDLIDASSRKKIVEKYLSSSSNSVKTKQVQFPLARPKLNMTG